MLWLKTLVLVGSIFCASLIEKFQKLKQLDDGYQPLVLDTDSYDLLTTGQRNYSLFVVHTALSSGYNCKPCHEFDKQYKLVASAWNQVKTFGKMYFATLDVDNGREVFRKLQLNSVPYLLHFPPSDTKKDPQKYELDMRGLDAEAFSKFVEQETHVKLVIQKPIDYSFYGTMLVAVCLLGIAASFALKHLQSVYENRHIWLMASIGIIVLMCSGHMWNQIRGAPYTGVRDGKPQLFAPGFQSQYIGETQVIGMFYALSSVMFISLTYKVPTIERKGFQRTVCFAFLLGFLLLYSMLLNIFRLKNGGYPLRLLF